MVSREIEERPEVTDGEWIALPGGGLEGQRPKGMCPACRERLRAAARAAESAVAGPQPRVPLCFACYRVDQARERALLAARNLLTASEARFQSTLPFEPVNRVRLEQLRAERSTARAGLTGSAR